MRWTVIPEDPEMKLPYDDVLGRAVTVRLEDNLRFDLVAESVHKKKFLVESDGELLLVCWYKSSYVDAEGILQGDVRFDVFRLHEKDKKWVELTSLGKDRVLFCGEDYAFSAPASDLRIADGNCIIFSDDDDDDVSRNVHSTQLEKISVFHLDQRRTSPLSDYSNLFWPPPEWVGLRINDN